MLQGIAEHGQVVHRAEGRRVLRLKRQALVDQDRAGLVGGQVDVFCYNYF